MCIIKRYNGKVLTVNGFYALKCIGTHLYHPIVSDTNHWEKTEIPNSQLGISVLPMSPEQGISGHGISQDLPCLVFIFYPPSDIPSMQSVSVDS